MQKCIAPLLFVLVVLLAAYAGSYWMLLKDSAVGASSANSNALYIVPVEEYHIFGQKTYLLYRFYWPANQVDRLIRQDHYRVRRV